MNGEELVKWDEVLCAMNRSHCLVHYATSQHMLQKWNMVQLLINYAFLSHLPEQIIYFYKVSLIKTSLNLRKRFNRWMKYAITVILKH